MQRQYSGTLGKIGNCQVGVSLTIATRREHVPIDFALYMPKSWTEDAARREKSKVPADLVFKTKPELALELIARAVEDPIPGEIVLVDSAYGSSSEFRNAVRAHGLDLGVAVQANTKVWPLDRLGRRRGEPVSVQDLGVKLGRRAFGNSLGTSALVASSGLRFTFRRVKVAHDDGTEAQDRESLWLMIEWPGGESKPTKFALTTLPRRLSKKEIVRIIKERRRTEQAYEELEGELGLDHFEGRSFITSASSSRGLLPAGCRGVPPVTGLVTLLMNTRLVTIDLPFLGQPLAVMLEIGVQPGTSLTLQSEDIADTLSETSRST